MDHNFKFVVYFCCIKHGGPLYKKRKQSYRGKNKDDGVTDFWEDSK